MFDEDDVAVNHGSLPVSNNDYDQQHYINDYMFVTQQGQQEALAQEQDTDMSDVAEDAAAMTTIPTQPTFQLMNRLPVLLSLSCDSIRLSKYQCLVSTTP